MVWPKSNAAWWYEKITHNRERDIETDAVLAEAGWAPFRVWEHEDLAVAATRLEKLHRQRLKEV